ncbi:terminase small subunit [Castellaniella sp.]|uniref:terminase small subunit n=1 Tax=Castellaniella sp. TaxID=1955812 RepID=UPI002AFECBF1|nr:terminase small subunit [Castellaniella sp.]
MNPKQAAFVREYLVDTNATQAAIRAGYSRRTAQRIGSENLSKPVIAAAIEKAMLERAERTGVTTDRVVQELANLAFFDPADIYDADGALKPISDIPPAARSAIAGLEIAEIRDSDGVPVGRAVKLKLTDRLGALDKLMRHLGQYQDKVTLKGDAENPLTLLVKAIQGNSIRPVPTHALPGPEEDGMV